jgi:hypothetical protein
MMATTISIPTHTPALKIPPITSQEERRVIRKNKLPYISAFLFIFNFYHSPMQKPYPLKGFLDRSFFFTSGPFHNHKPEATTNGKMKHFNAVTASGILETGP